MKWKIALAFLFVVLTLGALTVSVARAECPANELYCEQWQPADQALKMRRLVLEYINASHADVLKDCNQACVDNYDAASAGLLSAFAKKNQFDKNATVKAMIALNYDWGYRFERLYNRPPIGADWGLHYPFGVGELAEKTRSNNPMVLLASDGSAWCITPEYGGHCSSRW